MIALCLQILYVACALSLAVYTLGQGVLLWQYGRYRHNSTSPLAPSEWPAVTIQLPIYNEQYVVQRLLQAIMRLDYPPEKLCIQILDDSTDATSRHIAAFIRRYPHINFQHIQRPQRDGFKAGALAYGLTQTDAAFVAIFDADFVPPPDFLRRTVPYLLADDTLGVVQTRWGHLNAEANWLTQAQRLAVDAHFVIEQIGRNRSGWPIPFNGTGGVWRVEAIAAAGGWSDETLTEDLDVSFRAQMRGWRSLMLPDVVVPGELPPQLTAYRQQQARWAQGNAQCLRKLLLPLWQSDLSLSAKVMGTQHLWQYMPQLAMLMLLLLAPPLLLLDALHSLALAPLGFISLIPPLMYAVSQQASQPHRYKNLRAFPVLMLLGTGLVWSNSRAVIRGLRYVGGTFERTPKFVHAHHKSRYTVQQQDTLGERILLLYALWGCWLAIQTQPTALPYLLIYALAFGAVIIGAWRENWHIEHLPKTVKHTPNEP